MKFKDIIVKLKSFLIECKRVWTVTRKPNKEEFKVIMKVTSIGILVIGAIGFLINMLWQLLSLITVVTCLVLFWLPGLLE